MTGVKVCFNFCCKKENGWIWGKNYNIFILFSI